MVSPEPPAPMPADAADVISALVDAGLLAATETPVLTRLTGGVASDIYKVDCAAGSFCIKRALPRLRVAQDWYVPTERNANEAAWIETANAVVPGCAPRLLAHLSALGMLAMTYLPPDTHPVWKELLREGRADAAFAAEVGRRIGCIHAGTAGRPDIARRFASDAIFHAIRLEAYLEASARAHPELAEPLMQLSRRTLATKRALVHGDVSPKNILAGPDGPVFLDAECAWYGDPAFDLAFCLNHLLLKCLWTPAARAGFAACFRALTSAYLAQVTWEPRPAIEARTAALLPGLLLARVDGKSPVEYVTDEADKARIRRVAGALLMRPAARLDEIWRGWEQSLAR